MSFAHQHLQFMCVIGVLRSFLDWYFAFAFLCACVEEDNFYLLFQL
jgi:hypothetical protein